MVWTTYDISEITDALVTQLTNAVQFSPLWTSEGGSIPNFQVNVTGNSPDTMRNGQEGECQLNLYLLHVAQNPYLRNTPILGTSAMQNTQQPMSLDLTYLLTAYAQQNADREQQAMSIALSWFHENPIYSAAGGEYLTVNLGADTLSEMSALWQSFTVAYRLSTIYRVAVALLTPSKAPSTPMPPPKTMGLVVAPAVAPLDVTPQVFQAARQITFTIPAGDTDDATAVTTTAGSLSIAGGQPVLIGGQGMKTTPPIDVFLTSLDSASSWTITGWVTGTDLDSDLVMNPPDAYAIGPGASPPPTTTPKPGVYLLSVGKVTAQSPGVPVVIVPRFTNLLTPPILPSVAAVRTVTGAGFTPDATLVFVGGAPLSPVNPPGSPLSAGFFSIDQFGTAITFMPPIGLPAGLAWVRIRVDGVEAPPTWQVSLP